MADPGEGLGGAGPPLFFDQNETQRAEKNFFGDRTPLSQGLDERPPPPPTLSEGLDPPLIAYFPFKRKQDEISVHLLF